MLFADVGPEKELGHGDRIRSIADTQVQYGVAKNTVLAAHDLL